MNAITRIAVVCTYVYVMHTGTQLVSKLFGSRAPRVST
jgi:hypothetical protein